VLRDDAVDAVIVIYAPPVVTDAQAIARAVAAAVAAAGGSKPVAACFLGRLDVAEELRGDGDARRTIPTFAFPEAAARALGRVAGLSAWRARPVGERPDLDGVDTDAARALVTSRVTDAGAWLDEADADVVLRAVGIPTVAAARVFDADAACAAAARVGYPVVLKVGSADIVHKSDAGGVVLGIDTEPAVVAAYTAMHDRLGDAMGGAVVQHMEPPGLEVIVGVTQDPLFGPLLLFGLGGVTAELLADRALRILPLTGADVHELVRSLRASPLLFGYRGAPPLAVAALEDVILRVARLAQDVPEIAEMDLNPVIVRETGVVVVDARLRCRPAPPSPPPDLRRLRDS